VVSEIVVDTSVFLALVKGERIDLDAIAILNGAVMSAVNYAEILTKLNDLRKLPTDLEVANALSLLDRIEPFTENRAVIASALRSETRHAGLSLADRACLGLALELNADVYTADRNWSRVDIGCAIHLIR